MRYLETFFIIVFLIVLLPASGLCLSASAQVDRNQITSAEAVTLRIVVEGGEGKVDTSGIKDFDVTSRGTTSSISIVNGRYSKTLIYNFQLIPLKTGKLLIPALKVSEGKETVRTEAIMILVSDTPAAKNAQNDIFAEAEISADQFYLGQQGFYVFRLYSAVSFSDAKLQQPSFSGFSAKEAGERKNYVKNINGRAYDVTEITYALIPEAQGEFEIDPAVVICRIPVPGRRDPFGDSFFRDRFFSMGATRPVRITTQPVKVSVIALPPYKGADPFTGLVGQFGIGAGIDQNTVKSGESVTLTLTVSGTGNIMDAGFPGLELPADFKVYDDSPTETIQLTGRGYSGEKVFKKALVPVKPGDYTIGPVKLTYFDTQKKSYETVETPSLALSVIASDNSAQGTIALENRQLKRPNNKMADVEVTGQDILALKEGPQVLISKKGMSLSWFLVCMAFPCGVFFLFKGIMRLGSREVSPGQVMLKQAQAAFDLAAKTSDSEEVFLKHLHSAVMSRLIALAGRSGKSLTIDEIKEILNRSGYPDSVFNEASVLIQEIEQARYSKAAADPENRQKFLSRVRKLFNVLGMAFMLFCLVSGPAPGSWADDSGTIYLEAVHQYKAGDYPAAAKAFERVAESGIRNGDLFYNIGNAWFKAGDIGRAILWYERASKLIPNDPDLHFNMAYAKGFVKDKPDEETLNLSDLVFAWKKRLPSWILQYVALSVCVVFFGYAGVRTFRRRRVFTIAGGLLFGIFLLLSLTCVFDYYQSRAASQAVVLKEQVAVRSGFSPDSTELFVLHAGTLVEVEETRNDFLKIIFSKGKIGWIKLGEAEVI